MELIEREALYTFLTDQLDKETGAYSKGRNAGIHVARSALHNKQITPTIDAAPVVHGKWEVVKVYGKTALYRCTACKTEMVDSVGREDYHRYCHNCGARMDGGGILPAL